ncbi:MAG: DUF5011 domain-containing protein [Oscillospiraceae bacterium]|nr:DUF5011 domain-containing protein [Oscillospiraceae bacterium]
MKYEKTPERAARRRKKRIAGILAGAAVLAAALAAWVVFAERPSVELNGAAQVTITYGGEYTEKGARATIAGRDASDRLVITSDVDVSRLGTYTVTYALRLPAPLPLTVRKTRTVVVEDKKIPALTLAFTDDMLLAVGEPYAEPGYTAVDNFDGDITDRVAVSGAVDSDTPGTYALTYSVTDSNGNTAIAKRTVTVTENSPLTADLASFSLDGYFPSAILPETPDAGEDYLLGTVFVGDSITQNLAAMGNLPYANVWYKASINPLLAKTWTVAVDGQDSGLTIAGAAALYKPARVVLTMGIGSVGYMPAEEFAQYYKELIGDILAGSPGTDVIVQSVFPVIHDYDLRGADAENNTKINHYNYYLAKMCADIGVKFLNTAPILKNADGWGPDDYFIDGFHPTREKNEAILYYVRTHAWRADGEENQ